MKPTSPDYRSFLIYRCLIGSQAYGLAHEGSDQDVRGIFLPSAEQTWSLAGVPEQIEDDQAQECFWELGKFLRLALRANPTILESLYTPIVLETSLLAEELRGMRRVFLSQQAYETYGRYADAQFRKLERQMEAQGEIKWKQAMHLIRLLLAGITILREERVLVDVREYREPLLAIRNGQWTRLEVDAWRRELLKELDEAYRSTRLPATADWAAVDAFLIKARRSRL